VTVCAFERGGARFHLGVGQGLLEDKASQRGIVMEESVGQWLSINCTSDVRLDRLVFSNRRPGLRLGSVMVEMKEDAELLVLSV
jgi:hypothetical protein